jgi:hypothetical protein
MIYLGLSLQTVPINRENEAINNTITEIYQIRSSGDTILEPTLFEIK